MKSVKEEIYSVKVKHSAQERFDKRYGKTCGKIKTAIKITVCRKSMFLKQTSNSLPLSPCPLSPGKGDFTGATAPRPSKDACSQPHKATARCSGTNG